MVNKFGDDGSTGARGPAGRPGHDGFNFPLWFPRQTLRCIRENMQCSFYFDKDDDFITEGGVITGFKTHSLNNKNSTSVGKGKVKKFSKDSKFYAEFDGRCLLTVNDVDLAYENNSYCFAFVTFKLTDTIKEEQIIFGDEKLQRGVTITAKSINIHGVVSPVQLLYPQHEWCTLAVLWKYQGDKKGSCR